MSEQKLEEAREMLNQLHDRLDEKGSLNEWEQMAFDLLMWIVEDEEKPSLD